jgi:hypothetical protein
VCYKNFATHFSFFLAYKKRKPFRGVATFGNYLFSDFPYENCWFGASVALNEA